MKIVTLTPNPAFDIHCSCDDFCPYHESVARVMSRDAGGKGINISRALRAVDTDSRAVCVVGRENGAELCRALEAEGLTVVPVWTDGRIRENITLHEPAGRETRISFEGFASGGEILPRVVEAAGEVDAQTVITLTGSLPAGMNAAEVLTFLAKWREAGARVVIDSRSVTLRELVDFRPWLIKPNRDEAEGYTGRKIDGIEDAAEIARALCGQGVDNVMISLGSAGAVLASAEGTFYAKAPAVCVRSTIGAGDSMIAGFLDGARRGLSTADCLRRAVAFGTAACMREGTRPPKKEDVDTLLGSPALTVRVL